MSKITESTTTTKLSKKTAVQKAAQKTAIQKTAILQAPPLRPLPPDVALETIPILKVPSRANRVLGELRGTAQSLPNQEIVMDTLILQEALASSKIENIVTTQDEVYQAHLLTDEASKISVKAKEVDRYCLALATGHKLLLQHQLITQNMLVKIFQTLKRRQGGYRSTPGTALRNEATGEKIYTPPQAKHDIIRRMRSLENFINDNSLSNLDPLIKVALIHHQFESIHPFPDGNGCVGRMLNVLYLTQQKLLDAPILYLSRYINQEKLEYYRLLQAVRTDDAWEEWVIYMLTAVEKTATDTLDLVGRIRKLKAEIKKNCATICLKYIPKTY